MNDSALLRPTFCVLLTVVVCALVSAEALAQPSVSEGDGGADGGTPGEADGAPPLPAPAIVRGQVLELGTGRPLPGAALTIDGVLAAETDAGGAFEVALPPGLHRLGAQLSGFTAVARPVRDGAGGDETIFRLTPNANGPRYETVVRATAAAAPHAVSGAEARSVPGSLGDPFRALASLPGVAQLAWPAAIYAVRGANPGNTSVYLDGLRLPALFHFALGPSLVHPYLLEGIDFYPGGAPAQFGRHVSGVVNARTAAPPADRAHLSADLRLYDAGAIATTGINEGRGTVAVAARYSYTGALFSLLSSDTTLQYGDYLVRAEHALGSGRATLLWLGSVDQLGSKTGSVETGDSARTALQFHRMDLRWRGPLAGGTLRVASAAGFDKSEMRLGVIPLSTAAKTLAPRIDWQRTFGPAFTVTTGVDGELQRFAAGSEDFQGKLGDLASPRDAVSVGGFISADVQTERWKLAAGLRGDQFLEQRAGRFVLQPRLGADVELAEGIVVHAAAGRTAQMPSMPVAVAGFESFGLADHGAQTSWQGSLGVTWEGALGSLGATGFHQWLEVTDLRTIQLDELNFLRPNFLVRREGRSRGVELLLRRPSTEALYGWLAYTLSWSDRQVDGVRAAADTDQRHVLNLVVGHRLPREYTVGARFHYHSGRPVPVEYAPGPDPVYQRLASFHQIDVRAEKRLRFDRFLLDVYLELGNVTRRQEAIQLRYNQDTDEIDSLGYEIILPSLGVHGEF